MSLIDANSRKPYHSYLWHYIAKCGHNLINLRSLSLHWCMYINMWTSSVTLLGLYALIVNTWLGHLCVMGEHTRAKGCMSVRKSSGLCKSARTQHGRARIFLAILKGHPMWGNIDEYWNVPQRALHPPRHQWRKTQHVMAWNTPSRLKWANTMCVLSVFSWKSASDLE